MRNRRARGTPPTVTEAETVAALNERRKRAAAEFNSYHSCPRSMSPVAHWEASPEESPHRDWKDSSRRTSGICGRNSFRPRRGWRVPDLQRSGCWENREPRSGPWVGCSEARLLREVVEVRDCAGCNYNVCRAAPVRHARNVYVALVSVSDRWLRRVNQCCIQPRPPPYFLADSSHVGEPA
jgi:hypothetical protein